MLHYLVAPHPVARSYFHIASIGVSHTVNTVTRLKAPNLHAWTMYTHTQFYEMSYKPSKKGDSNSKSCLCECVCLPPPILHFSEAVGSAVECHTLFPP